MKKKRLLIFMIISLCVLLLVIAVICAFHFDLGARIWYMLPSKKDFYVYIPTDLTPEEAKSATVHLTKVTGFNKTQIVAEYWEEGDCFHVVLSDRGIYEVYMDIPQQSSQMQYVEIGHEDIYCIPFNLGGELSPDGMTIPEDALEWNGHSYSAYTYQGGWDGIQKEFDELGGYLATITSEEENEAIYSYLAEHEIYSAYFGLYDPDGTDHWKWVNGEKVSYTNWHSGEPSSKDERYAQFFWEFHGSTWNDASEPDRQIKVVYICEWDGTNKSR